MVARFSVKNSLGVSEIIGEWIFYDFVNDEWNVEPKKTDVKIIIWIQIKRQENLEMRCRGSANRILESKWIWLVQEKDLRFLTTSSSNDETHVVISTEEFVTTKFRIIFCY